MARNVEVRGLDAILDMYDMHADNDCPKFTVWAGRELRFGYRGEDSEQGKEMLEKNLKALEQSGSESIYSIRFYHKDVTGRLTDKSPYDGSASFKLNCADPSTGHVHGIIPWNDHRKSVGQIEELKEEIAALKGLLQEKPIIEREPEPHEKALLFVSGLCEKFPLAEDVIRGLFKKWGVPVDDGYRHEPATHMAGVPDQQQFETAMQTLYANDPQFPEVVCKLADLIVNNRPMYDVAKKMLYNQ